MIFSFRRFKTRDIPGTILKTVPNFCTVYVISKGKISATKAASRQPPYVSPLQSLAPPRPNTVQSDASSEKLLRTSTQGYFCTLYIFNYNHSYKYVMIFLISLPSVPMPRMSIDSIYPRRSVDSSFNSWSNNSNTMK